MSDAYAQVKIGSKLGAGSFGTVYKATWRSEEVVAKQPHSQVLKQIRCAQHFRFLRQQDDNNSQHTSHTALFAPFSPHKVSRDALMAEAITMASVNSHPVLKSHSSNSESQADTTLGDIATTQTAHFAVSGLRERSRRAGATSDHRIHVAWIGGATAGKTFGQCAGDCTHEVHGRNHDDSQAWHALR